jgi:hypothetical protein
LGNTAFDFGSSFSRFFILAATFFHGGGEGMSSKMLNMSVVGIAVVEDGGASMTLFARFPYVLICFVRDPSISGSVQVDYQMWKQRVVCHMIPLMLRRPALPTFVLKRLGPGRLAFPDHTATTDSVHVIRGRVWWIAWCKGVSLL